LRKLKDEDEVNPIDPEDIKPLPELIEKGNSIPAEKLYNYFIFKLKEED
jgi:hypothetical protein